MHNAWIWSLFLKPLPSLVIWYTLDAWSCYASSFSASFISSFSRLKLQVQSLPDSSCWEPTRLQTVTVASTVEMVGMITNQSNPHLFKMLRNMCAIFRFKCTKNWTLHLVMSNCHGPQLFKLDVTSQFHVWSILVSGLTCHFWSQSSETDCISINEICIIFLTFYISLDKIQGNFESSNGKQLS